MRTTNNRIKLIRQSAGLTQMQFAERIGLSRNYIAMLEVGQREPADRTISDICREFGANEVWLRTGVGEPFASKSREAEMGELVRKLMADRPEAFRVRLITALLRFDPEGAEWQVLENIYKSVAGETEKADS